MKSNQREPESALDAELSKKAAPASAEDWKAKVAIAKEARELGASMQRASNVGAAYSTFPR